MAMGAAGASASSSAIPPPTAATIVVPSSSSSSFSLDGSSTTYEATKARQSTQHHADRIHWDQTHAHRDQNYRQLFHQRGVIGTFRIRLLEARNLRRSYWSALALGPVKHLGWSKAHGAVSAFCSFDLEFVNDTGILGESGPPSGGEEQQQGGGGGDNDWDQKKPAAKKQQSSCMFKSPVVPSSDHPVWENCQFEVPLLKGRRRQQQQQSSSSLESSLQDGQRVLLHLRVQEDATALENWIPGVPSGGDDARLLGTGLLDLTPLLLGEDFSTGRVLPGVLDAWIPIALPKQQQERQQELWQDHQDSSNKHDQLLLSSSSAAFALPSSSVAADVARSSSPSLSPLSFSSDTGGDGTYDKSYCYNYNMKEDPQKQQTTNSNDNMMAVRILVSYQPRGLEPQPNDVVALESFARRNPASSSCRPLLPPLLPLVVLERRGPFVLAEYTLPAEYSNASSATATSSTPRIKAQVRLHRNAVFVIERFSGLDAVQNLALLPLDIVAATPIGQAAVRTLSPVVLASRELLMPAMLSFKLVFLALRTTTLAGLSGVQALGQTLWHEGTGSLLTSSSSSEPMSPQSSRRHRQRAERDRSSAATAQFVAL